MCCLYDTLLHVQQVIFFTLVNTWIWKPASACRQQLQTSAWPWIAPVGSSALKTGQFFPILPSNSLQMDESAGACSSPLKEKKSGCLSLHPRPLNSHLPQCLTNADLSKRPNTPNPRNSCVPHSSSRASEKCQKLCLLCWFKEPWSWFSLGAIKKRTGMEQTAPGRERVRETERQRGRLSDFWFSFSVNWWRTASRTLTSIRRGSLFSALVLTWHRWREAAQDAVCGKHLWQVH